MYPLIAIRWRQNDKSVVKRQAGKNYFRAMFDKVTFAKGFISFTLLLLSSIACRALPKIDTFQFIKIGGIEQAVTIHGEDRAMPLFLFITGGPGSEGIYPENNAYLSELKKHFVVVAWDQRNCGQTLKRNPSPIKLSVSQFQQDTYKLVTALLQQFHQKKLFIMGWSWGTVLGFYMADKHPELLYAYMAVSPSIDQWQSERLSLNELQRKAAEQKNTLAVKELAKVKIPFENGTQNYIDRKWMALLNGEPIDDTAVFKSYFTDNPEMTTLFKEGNDINLMRSLPAVRCPVYFFVGRKDHQTNYAISKTYFDQLKAPKKQFFWFERSGHLIPVSEPALLQSTVINRVLPQITLDK